MLNLYESMIFTGWFSSELCLLNTFLKSLWKMNWENNERSLLSSIPLNIMSVKRMCVKL